MTKKQREEKKMKQQLGISDRKSYEQRGIQMRPAVFEDKRAKSRKEACKKQNVKKILKDFD